MTSPVFLPSLLVIAIAPATAALAALALLAVVIAVVARVHSRRLVRERDEAARVRREIEERASELRRRLDAVETELAEARTRLWRRRSPREDERRLESLGVLAGGLAHEFNNLLAGIMGSAELSLDELRASGGNEQPLTDILHLSQRAADLCRQMLAYAGKAPHRTASLSLADFLAESEGLLRGSLPAPTRFEVTGGDESPLVDADRGALEQMLSHLVVNAGEALGERPGTVRIGFGERELDVEFLRAHAQTTHPLPGRYAWLEVADDGPGMPPRTLERVFEPFFSTKFQGRGLGLAAVFGIARRHRGFVTVQSEVDRGSAFRVWLPVAETAASAIVAHPERQLRLLEPTDAGAVLIVDDEPTVRRLLAAALEKDGFATMAAEDGLAAVSVLRTMTDRIACVLLDMTMPRMDGESTLREMRAIVPDLPVVVMSGHTERQLGDWLETGEAAAFLAKPFAMKELLETVRTAIARRGSRAIENTA